MRRVGWRGGSASVGAAVIALFAGVSSRVITRAAAAMTLTLSNLPSLAAGAGLVGGIIDAANEDIAVDALGSVSA